MKANYHTHTWRCHHAEGTEREYVQAAMDNGLEILGFSDHSPYLFPHDYHSHFRMEPEQLEDYVNTVKGLRQEYAGKIQIHVGLEMEYYPDLFPETLALVQDGGVEYLILGQHLLGNEIGEVYSGRGTEDPALLRRYCHQTMDGMNTGVFTYLTHPDLFLFTGDEKVYLQEMRTLCREAVSCGVPLEINLLGLYEKRHYPNIRFWEVAAEENCPVVLGRDAHEAQAFYKEEPLKEAMDMVQKLGLHLLETVPLRAIG